MRPAVLLLMLVLPVPLAAQQRIDRRMAVSGTASIRINDLVGMVRLVGWDRDSLVVTGELPARAGQLYFGGSRDAAKLGLEGTDTSRAVPSGTARTATGMEAYPTNNATLATRANSATRGHQA